MRIITNVLLLILSLIPTYSVANKPCQPLSKSSFISDVVMPSDLVAVVTIQEYSTESNDKWTKAKIDEKIINKKNESGDVITISKWRANDEPLFYYKTGDKLVLWLRKAGSHYELTNDNWNYCVPSVWKIDGSVLEPAFYDPENSVKNINAIKQLVSKM